ncbi:MAG: FHA domain-containing protein, partial [Eubacterium sp.]|nr:FHA domain-containing protein [Eubacterium sp.]
MEVSYTRNANGNFMTITRAGGDEAFDYERKMIERNKPVRFLETHRYNLEGEWKVQYKISGMESLEKRFERIGMNSEELTGLLNQLLAVVDDCDRYLINPDRLSMDPKFIYTTYMDNKCRFAYVPGKEEPLDEGFRGLMEFILSHLEHEDPRAVEMAYSLYKEGLKDGFSVSECLSSGRWSGVGPAAPGSSGEAVADPGMDPSGADAGDPAMSVDSGRAPENRASDGSRAPENRASDGGRAPENRALDGGRALENCASDARLRLSLEGDVQYHQSLPAFLLDWIRESAQKRAEKRYEDRITRFERREEKRRARTLKKWASGSGMDKPLSGMDRPLLGRDKAFMGMDEPIMGADDGRPLHDRGEIFVEPVEDAVPMETVCMPCEDIIWQKFYPYGATGGGELALESEIVTIGKSPDHSDVVVDEPSVSRVHARVTREAGECWIEDC